MGIQELIILVPTISLVITSPQVDTNINDALNLSYDYYIEVYEEQKEEEKELAQQTQVLVEASKFNENGLILSEGVASEEVYRLESFLKHIGYSGFDEDYYFNNTTKEVVKDYQRKKGLHVDGIVGVGTYKAINNDMQLHNIVLPKMKVTINSDVPNGKWLMLNKTNNTLYYLNSKEIISKYPIATGREKTSTPEGKFTIVIKAKNPAWGGAGKYTPVAGGEPNNPLGKRWMGLSVGGGGEYGIHGNSNSSSIGKYVSMGCVRMHNHHVEPFYDQVNIGTPVWIGSESKLRDFGISFNMQ